MFKTTLIAATLAATAFTASAQADIVPGSDYYTERADAAERADVANSVPNARTDAPSALNYAQTVPGSDYERTIFEQQERQDVRRDTNAPVAGTVDPNATQIVPGSEYSRQIEESRERSSVR